MQTVGPGNSAIWDYPQEEEANMDKFNVFANGTKKLEVAPNVRSVPIQELVDGPGDVTIGVSAENDLGESSQATVTVRVVSGIPVAPTNVRVGKI